MLNLMNLIFLYQIILTMLLFLPSAIFSGLVSEYAIPLLFLFLLSSFFYFLTKKKDRFDFSYITVYIPSKFILKCFFIFFIILNFSEFIFLATHGGHQALYVNERPIFPFLIFKALSFPAFYFATILVVTRKYVVSKVLVWLTIISPLFTGSRGLTIFLLLTYFFVTYGPYFFLKARFFITGIFMLTLFVCIGYYREPINMNILDYIFLVLSSLNEFAFSAMNIGSCHIPYDAVFKQFSNVFFGSKSDFRVATLLTECVSPGASEKGYGISSSILGESTILGGSIWYIYFTVFLYLNAFVFSLLICTSSPLMHMIGISLLPFLLYSVRTEIVYPYVFLIKILIYILLALIINQFLVKSCEKNIAEVKQQ